MIPVLVVGDGATAVQACCEAAAQGCDVVLVTRSQVREAPKEAGIIAGQLVGLDGGPGMFTASVLTADGVQDVKCGSVVLARNEPWPVIRHSVAGDGVPERSRVAVLLGPQVHGGGSHASLLRHASSRLKSGSASSVVVVFQEMLTPGVDEAAYRNAQKLGALFIRGVPRNVDVDGGSLDVTDETSGELVHVEFDELLSLPDLAAPRYVAIAGLVNGTLANGTASAVRPGVFTVQTGGEMSLDDLLVSARAAASLAVTAALRLPVGADAATVDQTRCSACLTCVRTCPSGAPRMAAAGRAEIAVGACRSCGQCVGMCPGRAISLRGFGHDEMGDKVLHAVTDGDSCGHGHSHGGGA